jgi:lysyl-tRNA synthetase class 2
MSLRPKRLAERARVVAECRAFFDSRGFLEVETPIAVPSPGSDLHLDAYRLSGARELYLATSPEYQMKRLLAEGHRRIHQIARVFRANEFGERHNPEFTMLEWYRAPAAADDVIADTEQLVARVTGGEVRIGVRRIPVLPPFERIGIVDAFVRYAGASEEEVLAWAAHDDDRFFRVLVETVEPALARIDRPLFVNRYPIEQASLARSCPDDPRFAERFELWIAGVELSNGFGELTDPVEQRRRLEKDASERVRMRKDVYPIDERFLTALERGLPPCSGNALGLDRLAAMALGSMSIDEVVAFRFDEL